MWEILPNQENVKYKYIEIVGTLQVLLHQK